MDQNEFNQLLENLFGLQNLQNLQTYQNFNPAFSTAINNLQYNLQIQQHYQQQVQQNSSPIQANTSSPSVSLSSSPEVQIHQLSGDVEIPRSEVEGKIDVLLAGMLSESLRLMEVNLNGLINTKFGFRQLIETSKQKDLYSTSRYPKSNDSINKRQRRDSMSSIDSAMHSMTPSSEDEGSAKKRVRLDSHTSSEYSDDEFPLEIVLDEVHNKTITKPEVVIENQEANNPIDDEDYDIEIDSNMTDLLVNRMKKNRRIKPKIDIENIMLQYHSNMRRNYPGRERSEAEQHRRDKNTLAARYSREKSKIYNEILHMQTINQTEANIGLKRELACLMTYAEEIFGSSLNPGALKNWLKDSTTNYLLHQQQQRKC